MIEQCPNAVDDWSDRWIYAELTRASVSYIGLLRQQA
jgi:hypothetical protein